MGVCITGYANFEAVDVDSTHFNSSEDLWGYTDEHNLHYAYAHKEFEHALEGFEYDSEHDEQWNLGVGFLRLIDECPDRGLRRSYGGYNALRKAICEKALGVEPQIVWDYPEMFIHEPYFHVIDFSDCEGVIGPVACGRLAQNWDDHPLTFEDEHTQRGYDMLGNQFKHARNGGVVVFA